MKFKKIYKESINSTNTFLLELNEPNTICYSFNQTNGRGRFDNKWELEKNLDIAFSISLYKPNINYSIAELNLRIITCLIELLNNYNLNAKYKIPNDIFINKNKICGVLIENNANQNQIVVGIGINVNSINKNKINKTSIYQETQKKTNLKDFIEVLIKKLTNNLFKPINNLHIVASKLNFYYNKEINYKDDLYIVKNINDKFEINLKNDTKNIWVDIASIKIGSN